MKKIFLIRHAESEENAGTHIEDSHIVRLSEEGKRQAEQLANVLEKPDRVIVSKYIRTQLTAFPLLQKYEGVETHIWIDIHEFSPHDKEKLKDILKENRKDFYMTYWNRLDPLFRPTEKSENFKEIIDRLVKVIYKLQKINDGVNYIFTHGLVIAMLLFVQDNLNLFEDKNNLDYRKIMTVYLDFSLNFKTENAGIYQIDKLLNSF